MVTLREGTRLRSRWWAQREVGWYYLVWDTACHNLVRINLKLISMQSILVSRLRLIEHSKVDIILKLIETRQSLHGKTLRGLSGHLIFFLLATWWWGTPGYHMISFKYLDRQVYWQHMAGQVVNWYIVINQTSLLVSIEVTVPYSINLSGSPCTTRWCSSSRRRPFEGGSSVQAALVAQEHTWHRNILVYSRSGRF